MIETLIAALGGKLIAGLVAALAFAGALLGLRQSGVRKGRRIERDRQLAARRKVDRDIDSIEDAVAGRDVDENRGRLKRWGRR